ncbi:MAG: ATP-binding cassette domain-containing protein [Brachybacterium tyrofermentans]|uniref:ATP-binding cassette domain-containing protein n=1 Tax=Brachybacterium tyrofermentans TaxID=47848 RepID=UPI003FB84AD2
MSQFPPALAPAARVDNLAVDIPHPRGRLRAPIRALEDVSLTAPRGRATALVGTNGAGKTTLLRTLTGILRPATGIVEVLGSSIGPAACAITPWVGVVPDEPVFPEEWTARDVIALRRRLGDRFDADGFTRMLREHRIRPNAMISSLSAGLATQFSIAHALSADPRFLILDEPFARLDPLARTDLLDTLRGFLAEEQDRSILISTHDLDGMDRFIDHLVVLHAGRTVLEGDVDELVESHVVAMYPSGAPSVPSGARTVGGDGAREVLIAVEDAVGLPPGTALREPTLPEIVSLTLAARSGRHDTEALA